MKKGFTLVEIIACLTLLGFILLITVPQVNNLLSSKEDSEYNQFLSDIYLATESYISKNKNLYPELQNVNQTICINLEDVVKANLLNSKTKNTKTQNNIMASSIKVSLNNNYKYDYIYQDGSKC